MKKPITSIMPELLIMRQIINEDHPRDPVTEAVEETLKAVQNDAYERAARVADGFCTDRTDLVAKGIRALKEEKE